MKDKMTLVATATFGLEAMVSRELKWLGYTDQHTDNGRIYFTGDAEAICKTNMWLRCANRIYLQVGKFKAETFEELFQNTKALPWEEYLPVDANFPVDGKSAKSKLFSVSDCQAIVKKAIVERLKLFYDKEIFPETGARYKIEVALQKDIATLSIDTTGHSLHKRGYREEVGDAPIKETLAAGLLYVSRWKPDRALLDPMCGTGTIPIEAALIGMNIAPGLNQTFDAENWKQMDKSLWKKTREDARSRINHDVNLRIYASDINYFAIKSAMENAKRAGVFDKIHFQKMDFRETSSRYKYGFIITNPPYGERLSRDDDIVKLYKDMGNHFKTFETWSYYIITPHEKFESLFGRRADKKRKLFNGNIKCDYYQFYGPKPPF
ncbi:MAG TPA: class I SAM-dependent RNA methyltransferase [Clostridia bacterium]|jgi:putative N6-adenine-specific DNA methylase|nr:class I SAM-dependent RNA methyltransferase [Clostridiaceae bacterium]HOA30322.1 class I SAM-dependent RNA methyltransferase [Clostridia bacterium]HPZ52577.1 class I SAM-dependent RNA methyltransferase [Clostridia bacterium]